MVALLFLSADEDSWGVGGAAVSAQHAVHAAGPPASEMGQDDYEREQQTHKLSTWANQAIDRRQAQPHER
jgi:hypothetical protein